MEEAFRAAEATVLARLSEITLAELAANVGNHWQIRVRQKEPEHAL
jgi:DNA-binding IscR family transcriptional regulator